MARHKPPAGPLDIKLGPGGLVDLEFAATGDACTVTADVRLRLRGPRITDLVSRPATRVAVLAAGADLRRAARILGDVRSRGA